ncbi:MAG: hypothetical protein RLO50_10195 [Azospirillaceae bacterium]
MAKKIDPATKIVRATLGLIAEEGWQAVSVTRVAAAAGMKLAEVAALAHDRQGLLNLIGAAVDQAGLAEGPVDESESARDRLFEVMMRRFDFLEDNRAGFVALMGALERDPGLALRQVRPIEGSMALMLDLAGMPPHGLLGAVKTRALTLIYLDVARTWRGDDGGEMAATMKALDRRLNQAEQWANTFERPGRGGGLNPFRRRREATETAPAADGEPAADTAEGARD